MDLVERLHNHDVLGALAGHGAARGAAAGAGPDRRAGTEAEATGEVATMAVRSRSRQRRCWPRAGSPVTARSLRRWPWGGRRLVRVGLV